MINARALTFALKTSLAAVVAILLSLWFELPNPGWAGLTVVLTSQPLVGATGAVVSRATYRCLGTLVGVVGMLIVYPLFTVPTELMVFGVAAWVGIFLYLSLLVRGPWSYTLLLAGYTVPLVGMPYANNPQSIFDLSQWRVEDTVLGAVLSICAHSVFAPRSVRPILIDKVQATLDEARRWILQGLDSDPIGDTQRRERGRLGADLAEMGNLAVHLSFEAGVASQDVETVARLEERLLTILPLIEAIEDRLPAIRSGDARLAATVNSNLEAARQHLMRSPELIEATQLQQTLQIPVETSRQSLTATELLVIGSVERLNQLLDEWTQCLALSACLKNDLPSVDRAGSAAATPRSLHVDRTLAAHSALAAALTLAVAASLCWALGWEQGASTVGFSAMCASMFAVLDDPRPAQSLVVAALVLCTPVAAFYVFAVFPASDTAVWLALSLAPWFFLCGLLMSSPKFGTPGLLMAAMFITLLSIQPSQTSDFEHFIGAAIALTLGATIALIVTSLVRVIGVETSVRRLMRSSWSELADMADNLHGLSRTAWVSRMLDRIGLLLPRLPRTNGVLRSRAEQALSDLCMGVNILDLRSAGHAGAVDVRHAIDNALAQFGTHFRQRLDQSDAEPSTETIGAIDKAIAALLNDVSNTERVQGLTAASGLRLGLVRSFATADVR